MSNAAIVSWLSQAEFHLVDPGDAGALPNDDYGIVPLATAGAETRTLQQPDHAGLRLVINMITDAGNCVITVASPGFDVFGSTTMTFTAIGQYVELLAVDRAPDTPVWRVVGYDGVTGITVTLATISVSTGIDVQGTLNVAGITQLVNCDVSGDMDITGDCDIATNATIGGTLGVLGAADFSSNVIVGGTLAVTGATTLSGATTIDDNATVTGTAAVTGDVTLHNSLVFADGGTVTQATSVTTGVTLNTNNGEIVTFSSSLAAGAEESFTVTNSEVAANDIPYVVLKSTLSGGTPTPRVSAVGAGSFVITMRNNHASAALDNTSTLQFVVLKGSVTT